MAIAFDSASIAENTGTSVTDSHTVTGSNPILFVGILGATTAEGGDDLTGVTYNGVAMTLIGKLQANSYRWAYLYCMGNPPTGAHNIVASFSNSHFCRINAVSYTGAQSSSTVDNSGTNSAAATNAYATSLTTIANGCWVLEYAVQNAGVPAMGAGAGTTIRGTAADTNIADSNSAISPAGPYTLNLTHSATPAWESIIASFTPFSIPPTNWSITVNESYSYTDLFTLGIDHYHYILKPSSGGYVKIRNGYPLYDDVTITFDDSNTYYEGDSPTAYTKISKPTSNTYTNVSKPT